MTEGGVPTGRTGSPTPCREARYGERVLCLACARRRETAAGDPDGGATER